MEIIQLVAEKRVASNKGAARQLRRSGRIPGVLYGEGEPKALSVDAKAWATRFQYVSSNTILKLKIDKDEHNVLVKDTQDDILTGTTKHIDFYAIHAGQKLTTMIPVHLTGKAIGTREGGILEQKIEEFEVVCLPKDMPENFTVDVSNLNIGDSIHVRDIKVPAGVEVRTDAGLAVVVVTHAKVVTETVETDEVVEVADKAGDEE